MMATNFVRTSWVLTALSVIFFGIQLPSAAAPPVATQPAVRPIPAAGLDVPKDVLAKIKAKLSALERKIEQLEKRRDLRTAQYLPDVRIFSEAVRKAIEDNAFFNKNDPAHALELLDLGQQRAEELLSGKQSWTRQKGLVVRGYRSRIDGSVQPFGLMIGSDVTFDADPVRCDIWFRGRSEKGLELQFLYDRLHSEGQYVLPAGIVLHPFGRYCNANRFAGEVDTFEALDKMKQDYRIDENRLSVRGFSMGGAACWDFTVHYPCKWFATNPGAGFSDTKQFLRMDKDPSLLPPDYQQKLWTLYDADVLADNLYNTHVVAYSGEIDGQKQAADIMVEAAAKRGIKFPYIIGPQTAHKLHPDSKKLITAQMDAWSKTGREQRRTSIHFSTFTLKYNRCAWVILNGLEQHWQEAYVDADIQGAAGSPRTLQLKTRNVTDFTLDCTPENSPWQAEESFAVTLNGQAAGTWKANDKRAVMLRFRNDATGWKSVDPNASAATPLVKRHQLQGPVDDAFMDSFLFVEPTGKFTHPAVETWVHSEMDRAIREWRRQMRGIARVKKDTDVTDEEIRSNHLILWGCPQSNQLLARMTKQDSLPIHWSAKKLAVGTRTFDPAGCAPIYIYPNPLNPERYIVLNSGLTYREADYLNNARQTPKIPDWAIVDLSEKPSAYAPGKIITADFFDEHWQLKKPVQSGR